VGAKIGYRGGFRIMLARQAVARAAVRGYGRSKGMECEGKPMAVRIGLFAGSNGA
jgi:hypothetical protein